MIDALITTALVAFGGAHAGTACLASVDPVATVRAECTVNSPLNIDVSYPNGGGGPWNHVYTVTNGSAGSFTATNSYENATGSLVDGAFTFNSTYTNGYTYSLTGTLDQSTGLITGTGTSSTGEQFVFITNTGVTCTGGGNTARGCAAAPAVANAYLKLIDYRGGRGSIISSIAKQMGKGGTFNGRQPCDEGYVRAVRTFVDQQVGRRGR